MIASQVLDASLNYLVNNTSHVYLCNNFPTTYNEAVNTYMLAVKAGPSFSGPFDDGNGGRYITLDAITDGVATNTGTAAYVVLVDEANSNVLRVKTLDIPEEVTASQPFTTTAMDLGISLVS